MQNYKTSLTTTCETCQIDWISQKTVLSGMSSLYLSVTHIAHEEHMSMSSTDPEWQNNYITYQIHALSL